MRFLRALAWTGLAALFAGAVLGQAPAAPAIGNEPAAPGAQAALSQESLGGDLDTPHGREIHIFFVHGIGSDGPSVRDSLALRKSICAYLKDCLSPAGEQIGNYDYADSGPFAPGGPCALPKIVALNDPSDLLTWRVPPLAGVEVRNYTVKNAIHWFWMIESPVKAHENYPNDRRAIREMLHPPKGMN